MFRKIWQTVLSWFRRRKKPERVSSATQTPTVEAVESPEADKEVAHALRRILLLTSGLKPYRHSTPSVRRMEVDGFTDAYRFMLRLCGSSDFSMGWKGGHILYTATLSGNAGRLELSDKPCGVNRRVVAVLKLDTPAIEVKEIRFINKQKQ